MPTQDTITNPHDQHLERWVDARAVAAHLGFGKHWVYANLPVIPHVQLGREYRFKLSLVDEWFASHLEGDL